jgi:D-beta-D-heptose 7-phosphate kinase/D-beta-D-heptose 1-phosphate adenosyltransferase
MKIVIVTGGFDPLHSGHIEYFKSAKNLGDYLVVGLNSDDWLTRKKGRPFMPYDERYAIINELAVVDEIVTFNDNDNSSTDAIRQTKLKWPHEHLIFANGGDRTKENIPEMIFDDVDFVFGVGGENKKNSSSWILDNWKTEKTIRKWGWYRVLDNQPNNGFKVKELVIEPGKSLSDQRHYYRSEHWYVLKGTVKMQTEYEERVDVCHLDALTRGYDIAAGTWHKASNPSETDYAHILEVQYGEECVEEDIERR